MVPYLDVQHLTKSFGTLMLFRDISFSIAEGQKVGLIAKNGTGKSTLLSILSGKEGYDSGEMVFRRDLKVGFLEQSPVFDPEESVLDACFNHHGEEEKVLRAKQVLTQLKIGNLQQHMGQAADGTRLADTGRAYEPPRPGDDRMAGGLPESQSSHPADGDP